MCRKILCHVIDLEWAGDTPKKPGPEKIPVVEYKVLCIAFTSKV